MSCWVDGVYTRMWEAQNTLSLSRSEQPNSLLGVEAFGAFGKQWDIRLEQFRNSVRSRIEGQTLPKTGELLSPTRMVTAAKPIMSRSISSFLLI